MQKERENMKKRLILGLIILLMIAIVSFLHRNIQKTAKQTPSANIPYLIVLGAKVNGEEMSLSINYRTEEALQYLKANNST